MLKKQAFEARDSKFTITMLHYQASESVTV